MTKRLLRRTAHRLMNLVAHPRVVLLYHRVTNPVRDPLGLCVSPENFRAQMMQVKEHFGLCSTHDEGAPGRPSIVVTFDDGYADNLREALPILEEAGVPATFFITTSFIGGAQEMWWDEIERVFYETAALPARFDFQLGSARLRGETGKEAERYRAVLQWAAFLKTQNAAGRDKSLAELRQWAGETGKARSENLGMGEGDLRVLARGAGVNIGAHGVSHTMLAVLPETEQRQEILRSKTLLEQWTGRPIEAFAFPFGEQETFTPVCTKICREAGYRQAFTVGLGQWRPGTKPFEIPRRIIGNWSGAEFAARLKSLWID